MESFLIYIGKVALAASTFYLLYLALFQHQKHFVFNRIYLPVSLAVSFIIPIITFTTVKYIVPVQAVASNSFAYLPEVAEIVEPAFVYQWYHYLTAIYALGIFAFFIHLLIGHLRAIRIIRLSQLKELFGTPINVSTKDVHPFSFFNKIVLSEKTLDNPSLEVIVQHENIHVKEKHTLDILFAEILFLFQWFNPFAWLIKAAMRNNLEYLTDDQITKNNNAEAYQLAMVGLVHKKGVAPFLTALNGSQLKNRIIMMKKKTENKYALLKQLVVLPLLAILVMGLSTKNVETEILPASNNYKIVVDGKTIPANHPDIKSIDFSKGFDGGEVIAALNIEDKVISNTLALEENTNNGIYYIKTSDYISGTNPEFEQNISLTLETTANPKPTKSLFAVDGKILSEEEAKSIDPKEFQSAVILSGKHAIDKYGEEAKDASVMDLKTGESNIKVYSNTLIKEKVVKGKVTDERGISVAGVTILIKDTKQGTITDKQGNYLIKSDSSIETLIVVMKGFLKQEVKVDGSSVVNILLKADENEKSGEVVVVGYGEQNSVSTNEGFEIKDVFKNEKIIINASGSLENQPLYVVDGKIVASIEYLDPNEIESVSILKDESATNVYGDKGKNGVVLVNTKASDVKGHVHKIEDESDIKVIGYGKQKDGVVIAGVSTQKNSNNEAVRIKLNTDTEDAPLFIVDGKEAKDVDELQPDEIESISVLKDKSATSLYGEKGKNGVVLIETKKAKKLDATDKIIIVDGKKYNGDINDIDPKDISSIEVKKNQQDNNIYDGKGPEKDKIIIQTKTKYNAEKKPLVLVDGVPHKGDMDDINPENIESISVLKDASAVAIYGEPGKDGVILITTKKEIITSELQLRKFIAQKIKYPLKPQEDKQEGISQIYLKINESGLVTSVSDEKVKDAIRINEVVVVGYKTDADDEVAKEKLDDYSKYFNVETKHVIYQLGKIDIEEYLGKTIAITVKFQIQ